MDNRSTSVTEDAGVSLVATFQAEGDGVRATILVKFPTASRITARKVSSMHSDLASAHGWVKEQAQRRGIKWAPETPV
jgi:hypothetical protein